MNNALAETLSPAAISFRNISAVACRLNFRLTLSGTLTTTQANALVEAVGVTTLAEGYHILRFGDEDIPEGFNPDWMFEGMRQTMTFSTAGNIMYLCKVPPGFGEKAPCADILRLLYQLRTMCRHPAEVAFFNWVLTQVAQCCPGIQGQFNAPMN